MRAKPADWYAEDNPDDEAPIEKLLGDDGSSEQESDEEPGSSIRLRSSDFKKYGFTEECAGCRRKHQNKKAPIDTQTNANNDCTSTFDEMTQRGGRGL